MSSTIMKDVQCVIRERTAEMESEEYAAFMQELAEYADDINQHFDND